MEQGYVYEQVEERTAQRCGTGNVRSTNGRSWSTLQILGNLPRRNIQMVKQLRC